MHSILLVYYYLILWFFPFLLAFSFSSSSSVWNSFFIERIIGFYLQPNRIATTGVCSSPDRNTHTSVLTPCEYLFFYSSSLITIRYIKLLLLLLSFENMYDCGTITFYFIGFVFCFYQNKKSSQLFYDDRSAFAKTSRTKFRERDDHSRHAISKRIPPRSILFPI